jgi:hypothetical protein
MKKEQSNEMEKFNDVMDKLLAVPYSELKEKLDEEKRTKGRKKAGKQSISVSRASQKAK